MIRVLIVAIMIAAAGAAWAQMLAPIVFGGLAGSGNVSMIQVGVPGGLYINQAAAVQYGVPGGVYFND